MGCADYMKRSEMEENRPKCDPKETLRRRLPIIQWLPEYTWSKWFQDALAGTTVGLTVIPQGIAYAVVAGLPPVYGLYSSFMGCFMYIFFGSTKEVTVGPTAIMGLLTVTYVRQYNEDFAVLLCFVTGCVITAMGLLKLGFLVNFISMPVITGFTNAAAIIIASSQINTLFGIKGRSEGFIEAIIKFIDHFMEIKLWDTLLGVCSIGILLGLKYLPGDRRSSNYRKSLWVLSLARNAVVVISGMILAYGLSFTANGVPFVITGNITEGLPPFELPPFSTTANGTTYSFIEMMKILSTSSISVPLIALLESIAIAKAFAMGKTLDSDQEMIAVGLCNVFGSFVRSMPTTGSFTRTAVNNDSGVQTPMGGVVTGALVLLACGLLTTTFKYIPKATLAAVIIVAVFYMIEVRLFKVLWDTNKIDLVPLVLTTIICLAAGLEIGMLVGIGANIVLLLHGTARPPLKIEKSLSHEMTVLRVTPQHSLSFPAAEYLREQVMYFCDKIKRSGIIVIDGHKVTRIDTTVAKNLSLLFTDLQARGHRIYFCKWRAEAKKILLAFHISIRLQFRDHGDVSLLIAEQSAGRPIAESVA